MAELAVMALTSMDVAATTAATVGTVISAAGTAMGALSAISGYQESRAQSDAIKQTAAYNAELSRREAKETQAVGLKEAAEERRKGRYAMSEALAQGAKGGAVDPTTVNIIGDIAGESEYRAGLKTYSANTEANKLNAGADLELFEAKNKAKATRRKGLTTAISGGMDAFGSFKKYSGADAERLGGLF